MIKFLEEFNLYNEKHDDWYIANPNCWVKVKGRQVSFYKDFQQITEEAWYNGEEEFFAEKLERPQQLLLMPLARSV